MYPAPTTATLVVPEDGCWRAAGGSGLPEGASAVTMESGRARTWGGVPWDLIGRPGGGAERPRGSLEIRSVDSPSSTSFRSAALPIHAELLLRGPRPLLPVPWAPFSCAGGRSAALEESAARRYVAVGAGRRAWPRTWGSASSSRDGAGSSVRRGRVLRSGARVWSPPGGQELLRSTVRVPRGRARGVPGRRSRGVGPRL